MKKFAANSEVIGPISKAFSDTIMGYAMGVALVAALLLLCCPATVARLIVAVDIDPFDSQSVRTHSHVGEEVCKQLPSVADLDATATVFAKHGAVSSCASLNHAIPDSILPRSFVVFCMAMSGVSTPSARSRSALLKNTTPHGTFEPAGAPAQPVVMHAGGLVLKAISLDGPLAEASAREISKLNLRHDRLLESRLCLGPSARSNVRPVRSFYQLAGCTQA